MGELMSDGTTMTSTISLPTFREESLSLAMLCFFWANCTIFS